MGTAASRGRLPPEALEHMALFRTIGLNERHVEKLYRGFSKIDKDGSGELSLFELLDHLKVSKTPFTKRVFSIFDEDGSGSIDFREFVLSTWNYATLTKSTLIIFAFDLYDGDESGSMELEEIMDMCKDVYGADFEKSRLAAQIIDKIHKLNDPTRGSGIITLEKFAVFCEHHPGLLYPAFTFQQALQKAIIGVTFWTKLSKERLVMPNGVQVSIKDVLTAHIDKNKFKELCVHNDPESDMLLPEKMQREARKTLLQRSDTANFKEIYDATGTVARRRSTQRQERVQPAPAAVLLGTTARKA
ncbi:Calcium-dependent protein kinase 1 [Hondaea fermentalgiana]|uniref:Calcium-dependent protein kinase 1 n=1 Tax=Hondaea fermentalgiana TaxID=2315210 RepID=A0A2R5GVS2_9STRA|nr:Calcium-dependent protein kinase 1 [Hondaea fermentalgiana]|eukprot:GBG33868.1 Calcium-dependent protein kinase 1 [Hondaea fermentalgiana]